VYCVIELGVTGADLRRVSPAGGRIPASTEAVHQPRLSCQPPASGSRMNWSLRDGSRIGDTVPSSSQYRYCVGPSGPVPPGATVVSLLR